jgi:hypothetical protein
MMVRKTLTVILAVLFVVSFVSISLAEKKKKATKVKGTIIYNPEKNYVKVVPKDYKTVTIYLDKGTKLEATVGAKTKDLANEKDSRGRVNLPKGAVTYTVKDGKPVAKKISYKSKAKWGIKAKKK